MSMPTSLSSTATASSQVGVSRHLAFLRCITQFSNSGDDLWLTACYQLTPHLQRLGHDAALLDLGRCTDEEAAAVMQALITRLCAQQTTVRAAIGPSGILAQFALLHAPIQEHLTALTPEQAGDLLRHLPIAALARLRLPAPLAIPPEIVAKLDDYGVRSLAHLARLDEAQLRRQFGARLGKILAAAARGEDLLPLQPTPAPQRLHFRLCLTTSVTPDHLLAGLAPFTCAVAAALAHRGVHGHTLELRLRWETGSRERITRTLPQPIADARVLTETMRRLLAPLFQATSTSISTAASQRTIEDLRLIVSDLTPRYPAQHAFWPQRTKRLAAARELAELLSRRHGKPLLFHGVLAAPDAIFDQDRAHWVALNADVANGADVLEGQKPGVARPPADVADVADAPDAPDAAAAAEDLLMPHGIHWW